MDEVTKRAIQRLEEMDAQEQEGQTTYTACILQIFLWLFAWIVSCLLQILVLRALPSSFTSRVLGVVQRIWGVIQSVSFPLHYLYLRLCDSRLVEAICRPAISVVTYIDHILTPYTNQYRQSKLMQRGKRLELKSEEEESSLARLRHHVPSQDGLIDMQKMYSSETLTEPTAGASISMPNDWKSVPSVVELFGPSSPHPTASVSASADSFISPAIDNNDDGTSDDSMAYFHSLPDICDDSIDDHASFHSLPADETFDWYADEDEEDVVDIGGKFDQRSNVFDCIFGWLCNK